MIIPILSTSPGRAWLSRFIYQFYRGLIRVRNPDIRIPQGMNQDDDLKLLIGGNIDNAIQELELTEDRPILIYVVTAPMTHPNILEKISNILKERKRELEKDWHVRVTDNTIFIDFKFK